MASPLMFQSFSNEISKIATRKVLQLARAAAGGKERMKAARTAARRARRKGRALKKKVTGDAALPQGAASGVPKRIVDAPITPAQLDEASRLGNLPGAAKQTEMGSEMWHLGRGGEGTADMVLKPSHVPGRPAVQVRKTYDPRGLSGEEVIRRKHIAGQAIGKNPNVAEYYGQARTPSGGGVAQFSEMVPGVNVPRKKLLEEAIAGNTASHARLSKDVQMMQAAKKKTIDASAAAGFADPQDIRAANMVLDARTGAYKTIDMIPAKPGEFASQAERLAAGTPENMLHPHVGGLGILNPSRNVKSLSTPALKQSLLGTSASRNVPLPALPAGRSMAPARSVTRPLQAQKSMAAVPASQVRGGAKPATRAMGPATAMRAVKPRSPAKSTNPLAAGWGPG